MLEVFIYLLSVWFSEMISISFLHYVWFDGYDDMFCGFDTLEIANETSSTQKND